MTPTTIIFFGSTADSLIVLEKISATADITIAAVVTQPPRPIGRQQILTATPVDIWAKAHALPLLSFPTSDTNPSLYADEQAVINTLQTFKADLLVSASYGEKIPTETINNTMHGGLNVHPSLLPRWRGADPVPWAIMNDHQTGVTVVTLSAKMDEGKIIAQKKIPITPQDTTDPLRAQLFALGALLLVENLPDYLSGKNKGMPQGTSDTPLVKRLNRDNGFEPWEQIEHAFENSDEAARIDRKFRALMPWPGVWTLVKNEKRLKILDLTVENKKLILKTVQLEGKTPVSWEQFKNAYLAS